MEKKRIKLKLGDILSFEMPNGQFGFARVLAKVKLGDAIEVFDYFSDKQTDYHKVINTQTLFDQPVILDGYSVFWKRMDGNWDVLERNPDFSYDEREKTKVKFKYGPKGFYKLIDLNDKTYTEITQEEAEKYPDWSPYSNHAIIRRVNFLLDKRT